MFHAPDATLALIAIFAQLEGTQFQSVDIDKVCRFTDLDGEQVQIYLSDCEAHFHKALVCEMGPDGNLFKRGSDTDVQVYVSPTDRALYPGLYSSDVFDLTSSRDREKLFNLLKGRGNPDEASEELEDEERVPQLRPAATRPAVTDRSKKTSAGNRVLDVITEICSRGSDEATTKEILAHPQMKEMTSGYLSVLINGLKKKGLIAGAIDDAGKMKKGVYVLSGSTVVVESVEQDVEPLSDEDTRIAEEILAIIKGSEGGKATRSAILDGCPKVAGPKIVSLLGALVKARKIELLGRSIYQLAGKTQSESPGSSIPITSELSENIPEVTHAVGSGRRGAKDKKTVKKPAKKKDVAKKLTSKEALENVQPPAELLPSIGDISVTLRDRIIIIKNGAKEETVKAREKAKVEIAAIREREREEIQAIEAERDQKVETLQELADRLK